MSSARKWLLCLLAVVASLSVVLAAIWINSTRTPSHAGSSGRRLPDGTPPDVVFATGVTSGNKEVDVFVHSFIGLCKQGDYDQYRLCWTAYGMPISNERFLKAWEFSRKVVITEIVAIPENIKVMHPAYLVRASVDLDTAKVRIPRKNVEVMVQWEENRWAVAPAPRLESEPAPQPITGTAPASQIQDPATRHG